MESLPRLEDVRAEAVAEEVKSQAQAPMRFMEVTDGIEAEAKSKALLAATCGNWASKPFRYVPAALLPFSAVAGMKPAGKKDSLSPMQMAQGAVRVPALPALMPFGRLTRCS
jgi:hypothetical protein